jgi:hypothetical protein
VQDLKALSKKYLELSDVMKALQIEINNQEKTDLDFFRYKVVREKPFSDEIKRQIRRKFRASVINFYYRFKQGQTKNLVALDALKEFQDKRRKQDLKLNQIKTNFAQGPGSNRNSDMMGGLHKRQTTMLNSLNSSPGFSR